MYAHFDGVVAEKLADSIVLDVNGVGYLLLVSAQTLSMAPSAGGRMKLYATLSVREDAMELFGFYSREEKRMFERLRSVNGVGPRMALGCGLVFAAVLLSKLELKKEKAPLSE